MNQFTIEAWTLLGVGILVTTLRTYARVRSIGIRGLQADDYLVWLGVVSLGSLPVFVGDFAGLTMGPRRHSTPSRLALRTLWARWPMGLPTMA